MSDYYAPCKELDECNALIEQYWNTKRYELCFAGHLKLAEKGYPLAECQVGYFYLEGYGVHTMPISTVLRCVCISGAQWAPQRVMISYL